MGVNYTIGFICSNENRYVVATLRDFDHTDCKCVTNVSVAAVAYDAAIC